MCHSYFSQTRIVVINSYDINDLEPKLGKKCSDVSQQTVSLVISFECETTEFVNTCAVSTQTARIKGHRLSNLKLYKKTMPNYNPA